MRADSRSPERLIIFWRRAEGSSETTGAGEEVEAGAGAGGISLFGSEGAGFSVAVAGGEVGAGFAAGAGSFADLRASSFSLRYLIRYLTMVGSHSGFSFFNFSRRWTAVSYFSRPWEFWPPAVSLSPSWIMT